MQRIDVLLEEDDLELASERLARKISSLRKPAHIPPNETTGSTLLRPPSPLSARGSVSGSISSSIGRSPKIPVRLTKGIAAPKPPPEKPGPQARDTLMNPYPYMAPEKWFRTHLPYQNDPDLTLSLTWEPTSAISVYAPFNEIEPQRSRASSLSSLSSQRQQRQQRSPERSGAPLHMSVSHDSMFASVSHSVTEPDSFQNQPHSPLVNVRYMAPQLQSSADFFLYASPLASQQYLPPSVLAQTTHRQQSPRKDSTGRRYEKSNVIEHDDRPVVSPAKNYQRRVEQDICSASSLSTGVTSSAAMKHVETASEQHQHQPPQETMTKVYTQSLIIPSMVTGSIPHTNPRLQQQQQAEEKQPGSLKTPLRPSVSTHILPSSPTIVASPETQLVSGMITGLGGFQELSHRLNSRVAKVGLNKQDIWARDSTGVPSIPVLPSPPSSLSLRPSVLLSSASVTSPSTASLRKKL